MKQKSNRAKLIDKIHSKMREIRLQQEPKCVICGEDGSKMALQLGHLITKSCNSVRFDWRNLHIQCAGCNYTHEFRPEIYTNWWLKMYGEEEYDQLVRDSKVIKQWKMRELNELYEELKNFKE